MPIKWLSTKVAIITKRVGKPQALLKNEKSILTSEHMHTWAVYTVHGHKVVCLKEISTSAAPVGLVPVHMECVTLW